MMQSDQISQINDGRQENNQRKLIGDSPELEKLRYVIALLASSKVPVLLTGETGTGKELVARAIHDGNAKPRPFVAIDCGALTESLIESEMFGHTKGAFTGAANPSRGLLMAANGGTVFLDEIGELAPPNQVKLLRVLQEKEVRPVGSCKTIPLNVRVIAASNRDLSAAVKNGQFSGALYFRLAVACVAVPSLRAHRTDVSCLIDYFLAKAANGKKTMDTPARMVLQAYDWPGNIRELEHCIEAACALSDTAEIKISDLPDALKNPTLVHVNRNLISCNSDLYMPNVEKRAIEEALDRTKGNIVSAAETLGMGKTTLYRKIKAYGLGRYDSHHGLGSRDILAG